VNYLIEYNRLLILTLIRVAIVVLTVAIKGQRKGQPSLVADNKVAMTARIKAKRSIREDVILV
jgi:hypothetical protein